MHLLPLPISIENARVSRPVKTCDILHFTQMPSARLYTQLVPLAAIEDWATRAKPVSLPELHLVHQAKHILQHSFALASPACWLTVA